MYWECSLLVALMPNQYKHYWFIWLSNTKHFIVGFGLQIGLGSV